MFGLFKSRRKTDAATQLGARAGQRVKAELANGRVSEKHVLPLVTEELDISKRRVDGDTVRVDVTTETELSTAEIELLREAVDVTRVQIDRPVTAMPMTRTEGFTTIIPVVRERLIVKKELVLVEEIHITHERQSQTVSQSVELRRQVPHIQRTPAEPAE